MSAILVILGVIVMAIGGIGVLIKAFGESVLWGLGCIFVPVVSLIFVIMHWQEAKNPFLLQLVGVGIMVIGVVIAPASHGVAP